MGRRKPYQHEELVQEIRRLITSQIFAKISDDKDMYDVAKTGVSPILRLEDDNAEKCNKASELAAQLVQIGEPAAEAVALGLRMQGAWRRELLPFADKFQYNPDIRHALELVRKRQRDPLTSSAGIILGVGR